MRSKAASASCNAPPSSSFADATWELMRVIRLFGVEQQGPDATGRIARGERSTKAWFELHAGTMADALINEMARRLLPEGHEFWDSYEPPATTTRMLSPEQVCELLQISLTTLQRWERERWVPQAMRIGRIPRWSLAELMAWFRNREWQA